MLFYWEDVSFLVKMIYAGGGMCAGDVTETLVLDRLKSLQRGLTVVWKNDWGGIVKKGADQGLKRQS